MWTDDKKPVFRGEPVKKGQLFGCYKFAGKQYGSKGGKKWAVTRVFFECTVCGACKQFTSFRYPTDHCECHPKVIKFAIVGNRVGCLTFLAKNLNKWRMRCDCGNVVVRDSITNIPNVCNCPEPGMHKEDKWYDGQVWGQEWQRILNKPWGMISARQKNSEPNSSVHWNHSGLLQDGSWRKMDELQEISKRVRKSAQATTIFSDWSCYEHH